VGRVNKNARKLVLDKDPELVARRQAQIVKAAIAQFSRLGFHTATVKDIANVAGVSPGLIYQYVPDKQDLLLLCLVHIVERNKREIPAVLTGLADPLARLVAAIEAYAEVIATNREAVLLTYRETKALKREHVERLKKMELETNSLIAGCITECVEANYLTPTHTELLVYRIIMNAHAWALKHWRLASIVTLRQYIEFSIHPCWTPYLTAAGMRKYQQMAKLLPNTSGDKGLSKARAK
jgi:AcrR family transcriptional regulator